MYDNETFREDGGVIKFQAISRSRYGGSFENRGRFAGDVAKAVRQAVGPDFHVNFRFSQFTMGESPDWVFCQSFTFGSKKAENIDFLHV